MSKRNEVCPFFMAKFRSQAQWLKALISKTIGAYVMDHEP